MPRIGHNFVLILGVRVQLPPSFSQRFSAGIRPLHMTEEKVHISRNYKNRAIERCHYTIQSGREELPDRNRVLLLKVAAGHGRIESPAVEDAGAGSLGREGEVPKGDAFEPAKQRGRRVQARKKADVDVDRVRVPHEDICVDIVRVGQTEMVAQCGAVRVSDVRDLVGHGNAAISALYELDHLVEEADVGRPLRDGEGVGLVALAVPNAINRESVVALAGGKGLPVVFRKAEARPQSLVVCDSIHEKLEGAKGFNSGWWRAEPCRDSKGPGGVLGSGYVRPLCQAIHKVLLDRGGIFGVWKVAENDVFSLCCNGKG